MSTKMTFEDVAKASEDANPDEAGGKSVAVVDEEAAIAKVTGDAPSEGNLVPAIAEKLHDGGIEGDFGAEDFAPPRINLVAKTSELADQGFTPGDLVFQKEVLLATKGQSVEVVVLKMVKCFQEEVDFDEGEQGRVFRTKQEVLANGGSFEWGSESHFRPRADFTLLLKAPEEAYEAAPDAFPFEFHGDRFALAALTAAKTGYTTSATPVANAIAFSAGDAGTGVWSYHWDLSSAQKKNDRFTWYVPVLKRTGRVEGDFLEFVESVKP